MRKQWPQRLDSQHGSIFRYEGTHYDGKLRVFWPSRRSGHGAEVKLVNCSLTIPPLATLAIAFSALGNSLGLQFFLVDFENVQPTSIGSLVPGHCRVMIFLGQNQTKIPVALSRALQPLGSDVEYLQISGSGSNAVDFHIAFYIGKLTVSHPDARFTIVSKDTGFDPLIKHLVSLKIACNRVASIGGSLKSPNPKAMKSVKKVAAASKPKDASNVIVTTLPDANEVAVKSKLLDSSNATRVTEAIKRLKGLKAARPATLKTLQSSLKSWFKPPLKPNEVTSLVAALQASKKIIMNGTKIVYSLG